MRSIDADKAKEQIDQMESLKPSERALFRLALDRTPTYEPPNPPLTLEELREMDRKPIFVKWDSTEGFYGLICRVIYGGLYYITTNGRTEYAPFPLHGSSWLAYRREPEEGTT